MTFKSVLLGMAGALALCTGAQAADAPFTWPAKYKIYFSQSMSGHLVKMIYQVDGENIRDEMSIPSHDNASTVGIFTPGKDAIILMPGMHSYMLRPVSKQIDAAILNPFPLNGEWTKIGSDPVDGVKAVKYKVTLPKGEEFVWLDAGKHTPLKMTDHDGQRVVLIEKYLPGQVDPDAFVLPDGYKKM